MSIRQPSRKKKILVGTLLALVLLVSFAMRYLLQYSAATRSEVDPILDHPGGFSIYAVSDFIQLLPESPTGTGLVFYPGGKVDEKAYIPLLSKLAQNGLTIVLVKMPFHLAVFHLNAATAAMDSVPAIKTWYLSGHSLGGAMTCIYAAKNTARVKGLILLAAYSTSDLSGSGLRVLSLHGTNDLVLNAASLEKYQPNLPAAAQMQLITGGNHGYFGNYGEQKGDGSATITREEQQNQTVRFIVDFLR